MARNEGFCARNGGKTLLDVVGDPGKVHRGGKNRGKHE